MAGLVFIVQAVSTLMMTGLIWFVQVVHYPLFALVPGSVHVQYAQEHQRRTSWVVGPLMVAELMTSLALLVPACRLPQITFLSTLAGILLVAVIWLSTALLQIPLHTRLANGLDQKAVERLVTGNWIRTVAWTLRSALIAKWLL